MYKVYARNPHFSPYTRITFSNDSSTETNFDYLYFYYYKDGFLYRTNKITGNLSNRNVVIPSNSFYIFWNSDVSENQYSWCVWSIDPSDSGSPEPAEIISDLPKAIDETIVMNSSFVIDGEEMVVVELPSRTAPYPNNEQFLWYITSSNTGYDAICIYNDIYSTDETKALSPVLNLSEGNAGDFSIKLPPCNIGYDFIKRLTTEIIIEEKGREIWSGRVISSKEDFQKNKTFTCEGELAYLNDTTQPQQEYNNTSIFNFLKAILTAHDAKDRFYGNNKQFDIGTVTVNNSSATYHYTNYETTYKAIADKLVDKYGGYIKLRKQNGKRYIDYISETDRPTSSQEIHFATNLLDFTKTYNSTDFYTVLLPLGKKIGDEYSEDDVLSAYTTVESVNDGSPYVINNDAVAAYGWIEGTMNFNDVEDPEELLYLAQYYLSTVQFDNLVLDLKAIDLSYLGADYEKIQLSDKVRVVSRPHGLDRFFPVTKMTINLDNPANNSFTLGSTDVTTMSAKSVSGNSSIEEAIKSMPSKGSLLAAARKNAADIMDSFTTGYITTTQKDNGSQELYISDVKISDGYNPDNPMASASKYWRWNLNGLAYYNKSDSSYQSGPKVAITMDGSIVADFINTGYLGDGVGNFYLDMANGTLRMKNGTFSGTINIGGGDGLNGVLNLYDADGTLKYKLDKSNGLTSFGKNYRGTRDYEVHYAASGYLLGEEHVSKNWCNNVIAYYNLGSSTPFAYFGLKGGSELSMRSSSGIGLYTTNNSSIFIEAGSDSIHLWNDSDGIIFSSEYKISFGIGSDDIFNIDDDGIHMKNGKKIYGKPSGGISHGMSYKGLDGGTYYLIFTDGILTDAGSGPVYD